MSEEEKEDALLPFADQGFEDFAALVGLLGEEWHEAARRVMSRVAGRPVEDIRPAETEA